MLKLSDIHTFYGPVEALRGVSFEVRKGEVVCLIGNNGAGKSTALMTISGIMRPEEGDIFFEGLSLKGVPPHRIVQLGISQVPEGRRIFQKLTVMENLEMGAYAAGSRHVSAVRKSEVNNHRLNSVYERVFELFPVLKERHKQLGGTLSGGEQQMLAIGRALMSSPKLLLLDEPSLGLAPIVTDKIFRTIREINREGVTVLLVEQNARAALKLSERGYVIENGCVTLYGRGEDLLNDELVRRAYLGE
jgi:branched-chain amino acid transport system ATP-binding protein